MYDESNSFGVGPFLAILAIILTLLVPALVLKNGKYHDDPYGYNEIFPSYSWIQGLEPEQRAVQYQQLINRVNTINYVVLNYANANSAIQASSPSSETNQEIAIRKINRCRQVLNQYFSLVRHESRHWIRLHNLPLRSEIRCVQGD